LLTKKPGGILRGVKKQLSKIEKWRQKVRVVWVSAGDAQTTRSFKMQGSG